MQSDGPDQRTPLTGFPGQAASPPPVKPADSPCPAIDQAVPNAARIYDWLLSGKDNYEADRQAARRLLRAVPEARQAALDNRAFLARVTRWLAGRGITQFLDLGAGLPAAGPVHEVAREVHPQARAVYADVDEVVVAHARALLARSPGVAAVRGDLRRPRDLMADPGVREVIDFAEPAAVLLLAVLHFVPDEDDPRAIVKAVAGRLAPGSYVALSHVTADQIDPGAALAARAAYAGASVPVQPRSRAEVTRLLGGLEPVAPGVTDVRAWRRPGRRPEGPVLLWAGVARVPGP
jgi:hypothetical protein